LATLKTEHFDILIIGAGISGIGIACRLTRRFPERRIAILERRTAVGGTWDLFRYPGIRSDSDMFSYAFDLKPWLKPEILASGGEILNYLDATIDEFGIRDRIRFGHRVESADWNSDDATWRVRAVDETGGEPHEFSARFLVACTGYYDQDRGYMPDFPEADEFGGRIVHPQHWPEDLDYEDRNVVVIGSGATAVTIVPAMAGTARHVTMLQRSPSYFFDVPAKDIVFGTLRWLLPGPLAARAARLRSHVLQYLLFNACRRWPNLMRRLLLRHVRKELGPDIDMRHFTPRYAPWDERLCILPEDDLLHAVRSGNASVVTDTIERFTPTGIRLASGRELDADIIVSATGFNLRVFGGMRVTVDGEPCNPNERMTYKGVLVEGVPNLAVIFGYINFSWTAKVDIAGEYLCRLLEHLESTGKRVVLPRNTDARTTGASIMNSLNSGYVARGADALPRQGDRAPWHVRHNIREDRRSLLREPIDDGVLEFR
jgi:cation diffusion facilitator CzcD-associated flavoprotein CzcO